jgi:flagellar assembly protein FliH
MGLVKAAEAPVGLTAFSMRDIEAAARGILIRARNDAAQIIGEARAEAEKIKAEAKTGGFAEGRQQGLAQGLDEGKKSGHAQALAENGKALGELIKSMTEAVRDLDERRDDLHTAGLREVVDLACGIARRVTRRQAAFDPQVLCNNLKEAMALAIHAADIRIAMHPSQKQTLEKELPNLKMAWPQLKHIELVEDAGISPGGVRIYTVHGNIDGQLETQLDRLAAELIPDSGGTAGATAAGDSRAVVS